MKALESANEIEKGDPKISKGDSYYLYVINMRDPWMDPCGTSYIIGCVPDTALLF